MGGIAGRLAGRWWVVATAVAIALVAALAFLLLTPPIYTATCILSPDRRVGGTNDVAPDEFLDAQRALILSKPVLASAIASLDGGQRTGPAASEQALQDALHVNLSVGEQLLIVRLDSSDAPSAARTLSALTEAYLKAAGERNSTALSTRDQLTRLRDERAAQRAAAEKALTDFRASANVSGTDTDQAPAAARLDQLNSALTAAQLELTNANAAVAAAATLLADPQKLHQIIEANRARGIFAGLDQQRNQLQSQLDQAQALHARQKETMYPQHPKVLQTQKQIDQLQAKLGEMDARYADLYRVDLEQQRLAAQRKIDELKPLVEQQSKLAGDYLGKSAHLAGLEAELKRSDAALVEVDNKLRDLAVSGDGAANAPTVRIVQPAHAPSRPSSPDRARVLTLALIVGLIGGLVLASIGKAKR